MRLRWITGLILALTGMAYANDFPGGVHVQGVQDAGQPTANQFPQLVGGKDPSGNLQPFLIGSDGSLSVGFGSPAIVTANQGTPNAGGASAWPVTFPTPIGVTQSTSPWVVSGTVTANQGDGWNVGQAGAPWTQRIQDGVGATLATVTAGNALKVDGSAVTQPISGTITANQGTQNGAGTASWNVQGAAATGSAPVGNPVLHGFENIAGTAVSVPRTDTQNNVAVTIRNFNSTNGATVAVPNDNLGVFGNNALFVVSTSQLATSGPGTNRSDAQRTPAIFKSASATASGSTAVWTPAAGKKFRLMRYAIYVTDNAAQAVAGTLTVSLLDSASGIGQVHDVFIPSVALLNSGSLYSSGWIDLGNGILSAAANNVLNVNLSAALTGGDVRVIVCGTEE